MTYGAEREKKMHYDIREVPGYAVPGAARKKKALQTYGPPPKKKALRHTGNTKMH